ncbi:MAG: hypothetical protein DRP09_13365 [Candidatus Thorarchaeota archaeon]|nr:MAG: hypothetical protein DRP09_13365 [Candidatus Thorarchaeota archaeon]
MKEDANIAKLEAASDAFSSERLRWLIGKGDVLIQRGELTQERLDELMDQTIGEEIHRSMILRELGGAPATITEIAKATGLEKGFILQNLLALMKWGQVAIIGDKNSEYIYAKSTL